MSYLHNRLRQYLKGNPAFFRPIAAYKDAPGQRVVTPRTDIVIEGIARSANTFAVQAFRFSQPAPVRIGHHFHAAAQILLARRWAIPAIVLIRDPRDAVVSQLVYYPEATPRDCLQEYVSFYERLLPFGSELVVGPFPEVVADFGAVIERVNSRYGTSFARYEASDENTRRVFGMVDDAARFEGHGVRETARPLEGRDAMKKEAAEKFDRLAPADRLRRANELFEIFSLGASP